MVHNLVRAEGVPAWAYSDIDSSVILCSLRILHSDAHFVVSLEYTTSISGVGDKQVFTLRYEGDNLVPGNTSLGSVGTSLSGEAMRSIARHGQPRPRTLKLTLKAPSSIWCPRGLHNGVTDSYPELREISTLARATEVSILFDTNWLGKTNFARLQSAVGGSRQLTGIPVTVQFARLYEQADWSIFNFVEDAKSHAHLPASEVVPSIEDVGAGVPPFEDAIHDAPPSYAQVSNKRSRHTRASLTPDSPPSKRLLQDPTCAPSPTERATSASSLRSKSTTSSSATAQVDLFQNSVTSAVEKVLPDLLRAQLPGLLHELLPGILAGHSPSPLSSPSSRSSRVARAPTQSRSPNHKPTPAAAVRAFIGTYIETNLQNILTDAMDQVAELHNTASLEFEDYLVDTRLDLATIKEDHIAAFDGDCHEKLEEFRACLVEEKDEAEVEVKAHADGVVFKTWDRLKIAGREVPLGCKCFPGGKDKQGELKQGRRAMSLPI